MQDSKEDSMSHVDEGTLHAYLDGELPSTERVALEAHLAQCATCRATLDEERALLERASALLGAARPAERATPPFEQLRRLPRRRPWHVRTPFAWAASIALALGLGYSLRSPNARTAPAPSPESVAMARYSEAPAEAPHQKQQTRRRDAAPTDELARIGLESRADSYVASQAPTAGAAAGAVAIKPQLSLRNTAPTPAAAAAQRGADSLVLNEAIVVPGARSAVVPRDLVATQWQVISRGAAASLLGARPVGLPGLATRKIRRSPGADGTVVVEQALDSSTVIQIFQRPASAADKFTEGTPRAEARLVERDRSARDAAPADRLARFVGRLRVEIAGPLSPDSLNRLLEQVEPLP